MPDQITQLPRHGRKLLMGLWLSRHADRPIWELPVVGNLRARIIRRKGARLVVRGRLNMGDNATYVGYVARGIAPTIELQRGAELACEGTVGSPTVPGYWPGRARASRSATARTSAATPSDLRGRGLDRGRVRDRVGRVDHRRGLPPARGSRQPGRARPDRRPCLDRCGRAILKGVTVGDGAVVGAGSVVSHDVPPACLVAGNPAKVIREGVQWR